MERKLASIVNIADIQPIAGADAIEVATVKGWKVVVKKQEYAVGDMAVYYEIDSFLPIKPEFEFLRKNSYKRLPDGTEGFRLKTIKLRGQISQGLLTKIPSYIDNPNVGDDVTNVLGITKYDPPMPAQLAGVAKGLFPSYIPKTDETRIQNFEADTGINVHGETVYITEKLDGSSATFYHNNGEFGVCSRNLELTETEGNSFWNVARNLNIREKLASLGRNIAIQGELVGSGVNGNLYKLNNVTVYFFTAYDIDSGRRLLFNELNDVCKQLQLNMVPVLETAYVLPSTNLVEFMLKYADGKSALCASADREGVVVRGVNKDFSFKAISNNYLLNEK